MGAQAIAGRYVRDKLLGAGGMAEVWAAHDRELDRRVAIKFLSPGADRERFEREARAAASLSHPNICQLFDFGEAEGRPFMVLECLPSGSLEDRLATGRSLPDEDAARISREIAAGLEHAHENALVHRDLKPSNILFDDDGRAKIADFGIARVVGDRAITEAGMVLGTAAYLSPEQAAGAPATAASDVYAFGVILYRMLTGRLPFESDDVLELVRRQRDEAPRPVAELRSDAPPGLAALTMASLSKDPTGRPADGAAVAKALANEEPARLTPGFESATQVLPTAIRRTDGRVGSRRVLATLAGVLLAGTGVAAAVIATRDKGTAGPVQVQTSLRAKGQGTKAKQKTFTPAASTQAKTTVPSTTAATESFGTTEPEPVTKAPTTTGPVTGTVLLPTPTTETYPMPTDTFPTDTYPTDTTPTDTFPTTETVPTPGPETTPAPATTETP